MNRVEKLRDHINKILLDIDDKDERMVAFIHLYGVAQASAMIAKRRGGAVESAIMAAMMHDLYSYMTGEEEEHAHKGMPLAGGILRELKLTNDEETALICTAIYNHSDKEQVNSAFDEILKDADVLQHCLYNPTLPMKDKHKMRFSALVKEFNMEYGDE